MNKILVALIDGTKARFLTVESMEFPEEEGGDYLVELESLLNPLNEVQDQELWSSTKTGRNLGAAEQAHSYDDHRDRHRTEFERRFAQAIATHIDNLVQTSHIRRLILVTEPHFAGLIGDAIATSLPSQLQITRLAKNLCHLKPLEVHTYLANLGLIPEPVRLLKIPSA